ncbi:MAG: DEAD/DEAH box helicase family protein [Sarcina sp.]
MNINMGVIDEKISEITKLETKEIETLNGCTGGSSNYLYNRLKEYIKKAKKIDIIVSFLMTSGVKLIIEDLKEALNRGVKIRILTGSYLGITQPEALYLLKKELGDRIEVHFYSEKGSFHPKAYIFYNELDSTIFIGSSNISRGALTNSIEWNYKFNKSDDQNSFTYFIDIFNDLYDNHSFDLTDEALSNYAKNWVKPKILNSINSFEEIESKVIDIFEPRGSQIPILYELEKTRAEGFDKGLIVAATGVGKTYISAFDSKNFDRILFVAHREEIVKQAMESFVNIRPEKSMGYFYANNKEKDEDIIFALVQTLGKSSYLNEKYFPKNYFDYIVIDEFHHASSKNYQKILEYFEPKFLLGLTATPERLDGKDILAICDYNLVYEIRLKDAINRGDLVPFRYYGIYDYTVNYDNITEINGKLNEKELEEALMIEQRTELILGNYNKYNSKVCIGFCSSRKHAENMAKAFNEAGVKSLAVYSGEQKEYSEERSVAIEKLKNGEVKVLFTVDMFNEGVDIPSIDLVLFLRPTESPTIFLQQLGRGLRKSKGKEYLVVLDFVGNYKKANLIPFLLSSTEFNKGEEKHKNPNQLIYPNDCIVDFDFQLIDLFKRMNERSLKIRELIKEDFNRVSTQLGQRPSRVEFFREMNNEIYHNMKSRSKENIFKDYMEFLEENQLLTDEELVIKNSIAYDFINMIETTAMSKSYKIPVFLAFYNNGNFRTKIDDDDLFRSFENFYKNAANKIDIIKDKGKRDFEVWEKKDYVNLARKNPVKFLCARKDSSEGRFFYIDEHTNEMCILGIEEFITNEIFIREVKDAIDFRMDQYYSDRFEEKRDI